MVKFVKGARVDERLKASGLSLRIASTNACSNSGWGGGLLGRHSDGIAFYKEMIWIKRGLIRGNIK